MKTKLNNLVVVLNTTGSKYQFLTVAEKNYNNSWYYARYNNLYNCYSSCSIYKIRAFEYCENILNAVMKNELITIKNYGICSYNLMQFTYSINCVYHLSSDIEFTIYITKEYNKIITSKENMKKLFDVLSKTYDNFTNEYTYYL